MYTVITQFSVIVIPTISVFIAEIYLPAGNGQDGVKVIVQRRLQEYGESVILPQILHLERFQSVIDRCRWF